MVDIDIGPEFDRLLTWWSNEGHKQFPYGLKLNKDGTISKYNKKTGATMPMVKSSQKVGRNDPCACGSNKKYKKCCLSK